MVITRKCKSLMNQRKKPAKLVWTQRWRIMNKKGLNEGVAKKRTRRVVKVQRAIVGTSAEDIKKLRTQKPEIRSAQREAAMREVKERAKEKKAAKQKAKASQPKQSKQMKQPKGGNKNARGGRQSASFSSLSSWGRFVLSYRVYAPAAPPGALGPCGRSPCGTGRHRGRARAL